MSDPRELARQILPATFLSAAALAERGLSRRVVGRMVEEGRLVRLRRGRYAEAGTRPDLVRAGRLGGRLDCLSLLSALGVFVMSCGRLHIQITNGSSRLPARPQDVVGHWRPTRARSDALAADLVEALARAVRCQRPREAIATLDSAWHCGLVDEEAIAAVFALLPRRHRRLRGLLDPRSESGPETIMRLMLRGLGCHIEVQVRIPGVGRVDFVVDGWLIVECDSRAHHGGWEAQRRDRRRDLAAAALGYTTVRPIAEDILHRRERTLATMKTILAHPCPRPPVHNSSKSKRSKRNGM